jgi:hypothetical protein
MTPRDFVSAVEAIMGRRAELKQTFRPYEVMPVEEMTPLERGDAPEAPSAVWTAWVLLALVVAALVVWSSGPTGFDLATNPGGIAPTPELIGP